MTNLAHWRDDIDDALVGDFDGSLSSLCIMSLSFDFSRNGASGGYGGTHFNSYRDVNNPTPAALISNNSSNISAPQQPNNISSSQTTTPSSNTTTSTTFAAADNNNTSRPNKNNSIISSQDTIAIATGAAANNLNNHVSNNPETTKSSSTLARLSMSQETLNDYSMHAFKRFKSTSLVENNLDEESNKSTHSVKSSTNQQKVTQNTGSVSAAASVLNHHGASSVAPLDNNTSLLATYQHHLHHSGTVASNRVNLPSAPSDQRRAAVSPAAPVAPDSPGSSSDRAEDADSSPDDDEEEDANHDDTTRSSLSDPRSPSRSRSCSSISTRSHTISSSRSQSPSDMSINAGNKSGHKVANDAHRNNAQQANAAHQHHLHHQHHHHQHHQSSSHHADDNKHSSLTRVESKEDAHISNFSVRDSLLNSHKDTTTYSTASGVIKQASTPMHFKGMHHSFSLRQFPSSPYHQFSNSSFNHDFYDRYLSHDSHQPLQTPLIGIERTQDLLSLKFPAHGPDDADSQRFPKDWPFQEHDPNHKTTDQQQASHQDRSAVNPNGNKNAVEESSRVNLISAHQSSSLSAKRKEFPVSHTDAECDSHKEFQFSSYKASQRAGNTSNGQRTRSTPGEPIDLNVSYEQQSGAGCCNDGNNDDNDDDNKDDMFHQSMKHFNPNRAQMNSYCASSQTTSAPTSAATNTTNKPQASQQNDNNDANGDADDDGANVPATIQYHNSSQESMFGIDSSKQKFQYALAAPISVATKFNEDTMTYLNQGQAYEIKLENLTDESKKGFMCSIINIGFHERHMQQAENELWQQWSQQHPNEKIFSVDMKLSYNVFGVESDGLNKCEFLWDSSKVAGVFIRINSISTEFTPRKHGGEKGVPFKLSIETFSYNSKTHDSYFISAACCQIKVFKPKGAERKIRSDRDKISKRPLSEQEKYHRPCDQTIFRECSLPSLHPLADSSLCYYRHSHGHFASKQVGAISTNVTNTGTNTPINMQQQQQQQQTGAHQSNNDQNNNADQAPVGSSQSNQSTGSNNRSPDNNDQSCRQNAIEGQSVHDEASGSGHQRHNFDNHSNSRNNMSNEILNRGLQDHHYTTSSNQRSTMLNNHGVNSHRENGSDAGGDHNYNSTTHHNSTSSNSDQFNAHTSNDVLHTNSSLNQLYQSSSQAHRASLAGINSSGHTFAHGMPYHNHTSPSSLPPHIPTHHHHHHHPSYSIHTSGSLAHTIPHHPSHAFSTLPFQQPAVTSMKGYGRQMIAHDKRASGSSLIQQCQLGPFKSSNSPPSASSSSANHNTGYPPHVNIHTDQPCIRQHLDHQQKDGPSSAYGHGDSYESQLHHLATNINAAHNNQLSSSTCRQRSASTSVAPSSAHCTSYMTHGHNHIGPRHQDGYHLPISTNNPLLDGQNNTYSSHWSHGSQAVGLSSNVASNRDSCLQQQTTSQEPAYHNQLESSYSPTLNQGYDSDHNSTPHKSTQPISESPLSCCAKPAGRANSTSVSYQFSADQPRAERRILSVMRITANSSPSEVNSWFLANRFNTFTKTFANFSGSDLLRLAKAELIEICGLLDGIRLYNSLHDQPIKPRRVFYVSLEDCDVFQPIYLYEVTLKELVLELSNMCEKKYCHISGRQMNNEKPRDKSSMNSNSSSDSRSSMEAISTEAGVEETYTINDQYYNDRERCAKLQVVPSQKASDRVPKSINHQSIIIKRLLIDGLTSVKIIATEQVVQMLDNDSVWLLTVISRDPTGGLEACLTACRPKPFEIK